ncbi:MAG: type II toxin-antitoxin system MqsA family antitoxin [Caldilineaceae bacterium]
MTENTQATVTCDLCGEKGAKIRFVSRSYGRGETLFVIENVPVVSCPHCGESYLTAETLHEIERIKLHRQLLANQRSVPVAVFA